VYIPVHLGVLYNLKWRIKGLEKGVGGRLLNSRARSLPCD
jgi:hypothetical protein